ncbi:MAG: tRNA uridine-5-carboxymethylaminomethyl(34) synthesis GTPase MnmE [Bacteroides sp.]|nr:tRNA uridine-5-carboxymethylaminomethyl(34) synthesis GTPase MnmE [Bacteroides sp.]
MSDTIAAIATGMGSSGIGIIRISGPNALSIADTLFKPSVRKKRPSQMTSYTAALGHIVYDGRLYDETICLVMKAPHSYTTEDTVEFDCHGGVVVLKQILDLVIRMGARPAAPGEFTKRAFLNGRIDMSQAESVMDLIHSKNEMAVAASMRQITGELRDVITKLREEILYNIAFIESVLDDPENYSFEDFSSAFKITVDKLLTTVNKLIESSTSGRIMTEGIRTVILGRPNVGKSSVLNMLLGVERAIVTDIAGTTRDTLEESVNIDGITLNIVDTAGIRDTDDVVERIGVDRAIANIKDADLILFIVDGSTKLNANDYKIIDAIKSKKVITLVNKKDLGIVVDNMLISSKIKSEILEISAKDGTGKDKLHDLLKTMFFENGINYNDQIYITNARHRALLNRAASSLMAVIDSINNNMSEDMYTIDLMAAYESLGKIIGEELEDDLINKIFKEFCMGK